MANGDPQQKQQPGWVEKSQPDGTTRYYPDDKTNDEIRRDAVSPQQAKTDQDSAEAATHLEDSNNALVKGWDWLWDTKRLTLAEATRFWSVVLVGAQPGQVKAKIAATKEPSVGLRAAKVIPEIAGNVTASLFAPGNLALAAASGGSSLFGSTGTREVMAELGGVKFGEGAVSLAKFLTPALKVPGYTAMAYFGLKGLQAARQEKQEGETDDDVLERQILGYSAFVGSAVGATHTAYEITSNMLVSQFGLNEDLAGKVATRVEALRKARETRDANLGAIESERDAKLSSIDTDTKRQVAALEHGLEEEMEKIRSTTLARHRSIDQFSQEAIDASKGRVSELERQQLHEGSRIMSDTVQVIREMEGDRDIEGSLGKPFREVGEKVKGNLTTQAGIYDLIKSKFAERNIQLGELPGAATKALGKDQSATGEQLAGLDLSRIVGGGVETEGRNLTFNDLTRIREDLWQASEASKDANVAAGLKESSEGVADIQQKAADAAGVGQKYRDARMDYMVFKRGLGSGLMKKWLSAADVADQDMQAKVGKLMATDKAATRAIRTTLKAAGIDTGPLDELVRAEARETASQKAIAASKRGPTGLGKGVDEVRRADTVEAKRLTDEQVKKVEGASEEQRKNIIEEAKKKGEVHEEAFKLSERDIERHPLIPNYKTEELAGKSREELARVKLEEMAHAYSGRMNVPALAMTLYGIIRASAFPFAYGVLKGGIPELVRNAAFQDWVIERSGVAPKTPQANKLRRAISQMGPLLAGVAKTGVPEAAATRAATTPKVDLGEVPTREDQPNQ